MTFIPSVGFVYASLDEDHEIQFRNATSGVDFNFINENVDTWYLGPTLGAQLHFQASEQISLQIGGTAWLTYAESDYDGNQQFLSVPGSAIASDDSSEFAFRGTASASATYDTGSVMFSVVGGIDYWDYAPVIIHPAPPLGVDFNAVPPTASAHIESDSMTNYFVGLKISAPF